MSVLIFIWTEVLFRPLLNLLIGLYNTIGLENLGLAIVWLTIAIKFLLLPITVKDKSRKQREAFLARELDSLRKSYANIPTVLREEQKKLLKEHRFRRWPKILSLSIQGLILLLLYQVFLGGINLAEVVDQLYAWVTVPADINTIFIGIDIAQRSFWLSLLTGLLLFANIWLQYKASPGKKIDYYYLFGFPFFTFAALWYLPAVKALFILMSILFSDIVDIARAFRQSIKDQDEVIKQKKEEKKSQQAKGLPKIKERF